MTRRKKKNQKEKYIHKLKSFEFQFSENNPPSDQIPYNITPAIDSEEIPLIENVDNITPIELVEENKYDSPTTPIELVEENKYDSPVSSITPIELVKENTMPEKEKSLNILFTSINTGVNIDLTNWINHHLAIGFKHIYVLSIGSRLKNISFPKELVTFIKTNKDMRMEEIMKQSYSFSKKYKFDWMMYLRHNEYIHINGDLTTFLKDKEKYDQILLNNRSLINIKSTNVPKKFDYYLTFSDMSNTFTNDDLNITIK
jgi:hypothetical protein